MAWANGRYILRGNSAGIFYTLIVRIDLSGPEPSPFDLVSCDFYEGELEPGGDPDQAGSTGNLLYLGSYRSAQNAEPRWNPNFLIVLRLIPAKPARISLILYAALNAAGKLHADVMIQDGGGLAEFGHHSPIPSGAISTVATRSGPELQNLKLAVDTIAAAPNPFEVVAPVTAKVGSGSISFRGALKSAGLSHLELATGNDSIPNKRPLEMGELRSMAALLDPAVLPPHGASLAAYIMVVGSLASDADAIGLMFDRERRRSAAVFYDTLKVHFSGDELSANYLYVFVHELGHCLNLPHVFDSDRLRTVDGFKDVDKTRPTFMNYPQNYEGNGGLLGQSNFTGFSEWNTSTLKKYKNFWEDFGFTFDPRELLELRHGARPDILTGDNVTHYRGDFAGAGAARSIGGASCAGLALHLRIRGKDSARHTTSDEPTSVFEFGAPIHVEARLRSTVEAEREFENRLSLISGGLTLLYQKPDGTYHHFAPSCQFSQLPRGKVLRNDIANPDANAFYKDLSLSFGAEPFPFMEPGLYRIRAAYRDHDVLLLSNILPLYVRYPTRKIENMVVPLLDDDVSEYFAYRGVRHLSRADERLQAAFGDTDNPPTAASHPLHWYYCAYEARQRLAGVVSLNPATKRLGSQRRPKDALVWFSIAFGMSDLNTLLKRTPTLLSRLPYSNIELAKLGNRFVQTLELTRDKKRADALRRKLRLELRRRGVRQTIREKYVPDRARD